MLYAIAHFLRDRLPWIWDLIDIINSCIFSLRFGRKLKDVEKKVLPTYSNTCGHKVVKMSDVSAETLEAFFSAQPDDAYTFFKPHGFDAKSIKKLQRNKSFLAYILIDDNTDDNKNQSNLPVVAGYAFIRSFFMGKGFRGRMVGIDHRGRGLGTMMNRMMNEVGFGIGLRLFETVNKKNVASYRSAMSASNVKVLEEMEDDDLYLEIVKE